MRERGVGGGDMGNETKMGERIARKSWKGIGGGKSETIWQNLNAWTIGCRRDKGIRREMIVSRSGKSKS